MNYLRLPAGGLYRVFGYNEFTGQVEFLRPAPWHQGKMPLGGEKPGGGSGGMIQDHDIIMLKNYLVAKSGFEMSTATITEAVTATAHAHGCRFHPVREYLDSVIGTWDGVKRVDTWLHDYAGVSDTAYSRAVARKTLCAAVRRIYQPGCKFDHILVLEGPQGVGKSRLVAALAGKWSADFSVDPSNKDTVDAMQGKWIVELAEMSVLMSKRVEGAALKAFITRESDRVRQAYGRLTREFPRQCLFIGTINPDADGGYLTDTTGNRRFWPVEVGGRIDIDGLKAVRNQLFAEVMDQYSKEPLYMKEETQESDARVVVASRHAEDPWLEPIAAWLETPPSSISGPLAPRIFVTPLEVFSESLGGLSKQIARRDTVRIANVMRDLGWAPGTKRMDGGRVVRGYHAPGHHPVESNRGKKAPAPIPAPAADESPLDGLI
jgi:putative DNA primase/helicase